MKIIFLISLIPVLQLHAQEKQLPGWVTDDKARVWVVNSLIDFMKNDRFYKIKKIDVIATVNPN